MGRTALGLGVAAVLAFTPALPLTSACAAPDPGSTTETILFIRHGEKLPGGFGQLSCKGLNRALALAGVLQKRFGRLDAVFAPDPAQEKQDGAHAYDYVRPLATVEPTAIRFGLPVHVAIGYADADELINALALPAYRDATVLVAWEHHQLNTLVPELVSSLGGDAQAVPKWESGDYDSIWRVTVRRMATGRPSVAFAAEREGLDNEPDTCPD